MAFKTSKSLILGAIVAVASVSGLAFAAGGGGTGDYKMKHPDWSFKGAFGTYDRAAMQRGYQVYREVCASCHGLKYMAFRHLGDKGGPFYLEDYPNPSDNPYVKNFAADWTISDIDSDTGDEIIISQSHSRMKLPRVTLMLGLCRQIYPVWLKRAPAEPIMSIICL